MRETKDVVEIDLATSDSADLLMTLTQEFYVAEKYPFNDEEVGAALGQLLRDGSRGQVWLISVDAQVIGYSTVTFGFSVEFGGTFVLLDEVFIRPAFRNKGFGGCLLRFLFDEYRKRGFGALRLEVERRNSRAISLYNRLGFHAHGRSLMTKLLASPVST